MPRWGPDAEDRLYRSAMQLILDRGYDEVTVAEIAEHAGLTKRSFFRHYADKREVMFAGAAEFQAQIVEAVRAAPGSTPAIEAVTSALTAAGSGLVAWGEVTRRRQRTVASSTELQERELIKMDTLTAAVAGALRERDVETLTAELVARAGVAVFVTAFQRWTEASEPADFPALMDAALARLREAV